MAIQELPYTKDLIALFNKAATSPMTIEEYAAEFSKITSKQILTGEVELGIAVQTSPSTGQGATTVRGKVV